MNRNWTIRFALLAICILGACKKNEVRYYSIPKETSNVSRTDGLPPGHPPTTGTSPGISWTAPEGWVEGEAQRPARGNFHIHPSDFPHADVAVLEFPPQAVQVEDIVHLLADELKLDKEDAQLNQDSFETFSTGGMDFTLLRLTSLKPLADEEHNTSILAAVLKAPNRTWFIRLKGADSTVQSETERFREFLSSLEIDQDPHAGLTGDMATQSLPQQALSQEGNPQWTVPEGWEPGRPSQMRRGSFQVVGDDNKMADIAVTTFPGDVGGMLANINRWRGQIGLGPVTAGMVDATVEKLDINGKECQYVDLVGLAPPSGKFHPQRSLVGTFTHQGNSWFFKMSGDASLVEMQQKSFMEFLNSVNFEEVK